jgi:Flp pilus assembly protein TadD
VGHLCRGVAYAKMEKITLTLGDFNKAIELNPEHARAYHLRGLAYLKLGERKKARSN